MIVLSTTLTDSNMAELFCALNEINKERKVQHIVTKSL